MNEKQNTIKKQKKLLILCESAVMLALSAVLSLIKIPLPWTAVFGGSITLVSMLPVMLISVKYGMTAGFGVSICYSVIQIMLDMSQLLSWSMTPGVWVGCLVFDYIIAYGSLGIAGIWRKRGNGGIIAGISLAIALRLASHIVSGCIFFAAGCWEGWNVFVYSLCYNGSFIVPELIITLTATVLLLKMKSFRKLINLNN